MAASAPLSHTFYTLGFSSSTVSKAPTTLIQPFAQCFQCAHHQFPLNKHSESTKFALSKWDSVIINRSRRSLFKTSLSFQDSAPQVLSSSLFLWVVSYLNWVAIENLSHLLLSACSPNENQFVKYRKLATFSHLPFLHSCIGWERLWLSSSFLSIKTYLLLSLKCFW